MNFNDFVITENADGLIVVIPDDNDIYAFENKTFATVEEAEDAVNEYIAGR